MISCEREVEKEVKLRDCWGGGAEGGDSNLNCRKCGPLLLQQGLTPPESRKREGVGIEPMRSPLPRTKRATGMSVCVLLTKSYVWLSQMSET